jgi:hypothetical protein
MLGSGLAVGVVMMCGGCWALLYNAETRKYQILLIQE